MIKSYAQIKAIEAKNKQRIKAVCPYADESSGIYVFCREENGIKYAYVGQAKHLLTRLAAHLKASCGIYSELTQHIDNSIKKHGLFSEDNPTGYGISVWHVAVENLDEKEREYIQTYASLGYQLRNKTLGGQDSGKGGLDNNKPSKGYYDGLHAGYEKARKEIGHLFKLHLKAVTKSDKPSKLQEKALQKFFDFLEGCPENKNC